MEQITSADPTYRRLTVSDPLAALRIFVKLLIKEIYISIDHTKKTKWPVEDTHNFQLEYTSQCTFTYLYALFTQSTLFFLDLNLLGCVSIFHWKYHKYKLCNCIKINFVMSLHSNSLHFSSTHHIDALIRSTKLSS